MREKEREESRINSFSLTYLLTYLLVPLIHLHPLFHEWLCTAFNNVAIISDYRALLPSNMVENWIMTMSLTPLTHLLASISYIVHDLMSAN